MTQDEQIEGIKKELELAKLQFELLKVKSDISELKKAIGLKPAREKKLAIEEF